MKYDQFEAWLRGQDQAMCVAIAVRAALRVLPVVVRGEASPDKALRVLLSMRAILAAGVAGAQSGEAVLLAARSAMDAVAGVSGIGSPTQEAGESGADYVARHSEHFILTQMGRSASYCAAAAACATDKGEITKAALYAVSHANNVAFYAREAQAGFAALAAKADAADATISADFLPQVRLWYDDWPVAPMGEWWSAPGNVVSGPVWAFWRAWYQGFLDGAPVDWEMQRAVAMIDDAEWARGAAHVSVLIGQIWVPD